MSLRKVPVYYYCSSDILPVLQMCNIWWTYKSDTINIIANKLSLAKAKAWCNFTKNLFLFTNITWIISDELILSKYQRIFCTREFIHIWRESESESSPTFTKNFHKTRAWNTASYFANLIHTCETKNSYLLFPFCIVFNQVHVYQHAFKHDSSCIIFNITVHMFLL